MVRFWVVNEHDVIRIWRNNMKRPKGIAKAKYPAIFSSLPDITERA